MSQESVEIVRQMLDASHRGDFEASLAAIDEDVEWPDPPDVPGVGVHRGRAEVRRWITRWIGAWESYTAEAEEIIDAGDQVVVLHHRSCSTVSRWRPSQATLACSSIDRMCD